MIREAPNDALVIALISGGGSALMPAPAEGITLAEKQTVNKLLLASGAAIEEINTVRKHLSSLKGVRHAHYLASTTNSRFLRWPVGPIGVPSSTSELPSVRRRGQRHPGDRLWAHGSRYDLLC